MAREPRTALGAPRSIATMLRCTVGAALVLAMTACGAAPAASGSIAESPHGVGGIDRNPSSALLQAVKSSTALTAAERRKLTRITAQPMATWVTGPAASARVSVRAAVTGARERGTTPVIVLYRIPFRDCGDYSRLPSAVSASGYRTWLHRIVGALGTVHAVVIVEPDALALMGCLSSTQRDARVALLRAAVLAVEAQGSKAYLDAGHAGWIPEATMVARLRAAGVEHASGFALDVAGFGSTAAEITYGTSISRQIGDAHFIVDTSRNGAPVASGLWCNPSHARLGRVPTWHTGHRLVDAFLWIKTPGLSDGTCGGGPAAGTFWPKGALRLLSAPSGT